ncbi:ArsR family transcriptional regulator [Rhizobium sp. Root274]|uniref:ArsR/SmtB family transcription factor n=1 Tax=unclassified Rhizobium TaxID=2613769 RepID=UPI000714B8C7|nr:MULTISPECIES: helix-turn-helix domain-containing protein [unclassified Rhizobium]KQW26379.1 ArsR family transcriptional regulator [Rhizobium sp. Root1240]KRD26352.1 ArsR family transcriptional regulator [Rhizobium sp. Root274]
MKRPLDIHEALKALAHPGRMEFLTWLKEPERSFGLSAADAEGGVPAGRFGWQGLSQSSASQNLAILQRAGLLSSRRVGSTILYRRNEDNIAQLKRWLADEL